MAYRNLINLASSSISDIFRHLLDFLTSRNGIADYSASGLGWTVHDESWAVSRDSPTVDDWVVIRSMGEDGKRPMYYRMLYSTLANSIARTRSGLYWNAATNAWVNQFPAADQAHGPLTGSAFSLWIFGSLDAFTIVIGNGTTNYGRHFGTPAATMYEDTVATTTGAISAGSNVVIPCDAVPTSWRVGDRLYLRNAATEELVTVAAISGLNVTASTVANAYASGAYLSADHVVIISNGQYGMVQFHTQIGRNGAVNPGLVYARYGSSMVADADPDQLNGHHMTSFVQLSGIPTNGVGYYGQLRDILMTSDTGITSGSVYQDRDGVNWRALLVNSVMFLFREV